MGFHLVLALVGSQRLLRQVCDAQPGRLGVVWRNDQELNGLFCGGAPIPVACLAKASAVLRGSPSSSKTASNSFAARMRNSKKRGESWSRRRSPRTVTPPGPYPRRDRATVNPAQIKLNGCGGRGARGPQHATSAAQTGFG